MPTETTEFDEDTRAFLEIVEHFLNEYFGHETNETQRLLQEYLLMRPAEHDENFFFHEGPYRIATLVHYIVAMHGTLDGWVAWLRKTGHFETPHEAAEYFRKKYFQHE